MTGVSKLLYFYRSRAGRNPEPDPGLDSLAAGGDSGLRRPPRKHSDHGPRRQRGRREDSDPAPSPSVRHHHCRRVSQMEPESVILDRSDTGEYGTYTANGGGAATSALNRLRLIRDRPLPDTVLQARARLLERLQSVSLTGSRHTIPGFSGDEFAASGVLAANDFGDWEAETPIDQSDPNTSYIEFTVQTDQTSSFHDGHKKPPPGLSWERFCSLQHEVFRNSEDGDTSQPPECCICLESFLEEEGLVRLRCGHRFHPLCLQPWVQACGDCPYCRANIIC